MKTGSTEMWMEWFWCVLQFVGPMLLRYFPFRKKLKIPIWALAAITAAVWGGIALSLMIFGYSPNYSMNLYCSIAILIFFPLSCIIIQDRFVKHFFVYLMSYNLMTVSIGISHFTMEHLGGGLLTANIATLLFYPAVYPFIIRFLRRDLEPVMDVSGTKVWNIAWVPMLLYYLLIAVATPGILNAQRLSYVVIRTLLGICSAVTCVILVICLRHAREQAAKEEALARVQDLADMKEEFLHNLSHELQAPITVISGFAQLTGSMMEDSEIDRAAVTDNMRRVDGEAGRMERLVLQLLDAAAIENGSFILHRQAMDMAELIDTAACVHFPVMDSRRNTVSVEVPSGLPDVYGDRERLLQVLLNLVSNAVKHTERGSVILSAKAVDCAVEVTVKDSGEGIRPDLLSDLFQRYPQNRAAGGNGLGLYICAQIVEAHGGRITAKSEPGLGTEVRFTVPVMEKEAAE
ncbi:sensor histidine kinase [Anaerostipes sp.]|uniref:sensor histidine kinase n=1 Tax=Anaerostipes sp. TaxID=1872530 RepID=UPI0025C3D28C|nr:HAMP domain-containing sensor histidine kinase [Anaerostipes sp.]MBS7007011.1 HAMP domain-containing histidine kinase [Anaerostipes sp.]